MMSQKKTFILYGGAILGGSLSAEFLPSMHEAKVFDELRMSYAIHDFADGEVAPFVAKSEEQAFIDLFFEFDHPTPTTQSKALSLIARYWATLKLAQLKHTDNGGSKSDEAYQIMLMDTFWDLGGLARALGVRDRGGIINPWRIIRTDEEWGGGATVSTHIPLFQHRTMKWNLDEVEYWRMSEEYVMDPNNFTVEEMVADLTSEFNGFNAYGGWKAIEYMDQLHYFGFGSTDGLPLSPRWRDPTEDDLSGRYSARYLDEHGIWRVLGAVQLITSPDAVPVTPLVYEIAGERYEIPRTYYKDAFGRWYITPVPTLKERYGERYWENPALLEDFRIVIGTLGSYRYNPLVFYGIRALRNPDEYLWKPAWVNMMQRAIAEVMPPQELLDALERHRLTPFTQAETVEGDHTEGVLDHPTLGWIGQAGLGSEWSYLYNGLGWVRVRSMEQGWGSLAVTDWDAVVWEHLGYYNWQDDPSLLDVPWPFAGRLVLNGYVDWRYVATEEPNGAMVSTWEMAQYWPDFWNYQLENPFMWHAANTFRMYPEDRIPNGSEPHNVLEWTRFHNFGFQVDPTEPLEEPVGYFDEVVIPNPFEHESSEWSYDEAFDNGEDGRLFYDRLDIFQSDLGGSIETGRSIASTGIPHQGEGPKKIGMTVVYPSRQSVSSGFMGLSERIGWFYSTETTWPWLYLFEQGGWFYFHGGDADVLWFYSAQQDRTDSFTNLTGGG
jgi:hypothetical protein